MKINYKDAYLQLIEYVNAKNVWVYDTDLHGPGMAFDLRRGGTRRLIGIDGRLSWKRRLFVLMHEVGHLFFLHIPTQKLKFRKSTGSSEIAANRTAVRLIKILTGRDRHKLHLEYARYYNSAVKGTSRNKFLLT